MSLRKAGRARWRRGRRLAVEAAFDPRRPLPPELDVDLVRALGLLSVAQRTAVVLHHLGGWPTSDIAEILGCPDVTVRSHLSRGRRRLAVLLHDPNDALEANDAESR